MKELIDDRNRELWNKISNKFKVGFVKSNNHEYGCYSEGDSVTFKIGQGELSKDSFSHEMLHVYFRLHECYLGVGLSDMLLYNNRLGEILSSELIEHIGNCFEHIKMLPIYLKMGFDKSKFLSDYHELKCKSGELKYFQENYLIGGIINVKLIDRFIGKLVAMLADPNDDFNYQRELREFKRLDSSLFLAIEKAINLWKTIDIENDDITETNYHDLIFNLEHDLENWYAENI